MAESMFEYMNTFLAENGEKMVKAVNAIFLFEIRKTKSSEPVYFTLNLKTGNGSITKAKVGTPDATFIMLDDVFVKISSQELNP